ncbi:hypothetical protein TNCT_626631 [Trichonephila clavata]|uniref:Uncharacterized protein n=1 Tax=Trichonephila clavata TaxID=2740835 RepID=A0A8X6L0K5_TRICU|nr:hypothetical protein TNCT_626631 [Trichonephila clavata]
MLASLYCFQDDMFSLWGQLNFWQRYSYTAERSFEMSVIWILWLTNGGELDWEEYALKCTCNAFGLRTYLPKLRQEKRLQCLIRLLYRHSIDYYQLQFCLSILDQNQQNEIFKKCPLQVLQVFLNWPAQEKLLDVVKMLRSYLSEHDFRNFFYLILGQKRMLNWIIYDYVSFVEILWNTVPFECKKFIEKNPMYSTLKSVLEHDGSRPFPQELRVHSTD